MGICQRHGFPHAFGKNPSVIANQPPLEAKGKNANDVKFAIANMG